jgi:hypothetical protein
MNFVIINEETLAVIETRAFDTCDLNFDINQMNNYIASIDNNRIVLVGIMDEGSRTLNADSYT